MKTDIEQQLKEFTRALHTKLSDKRILNIVHSLARSVLTAEKGNIKPDEMEFCL
jgi:hypothetical protein